LPADITGSVAEPSHEIGDVEDLRVYYDTRGGVVKAVDGVSFNLRQGERLALVGESGSGKGTLATALMGMTRAPGRVRSGHIHLSGSDLLSKDRKEMRAARHSSAGEADPPGAPAGSAAAPRPWPADRPWRLSTPAPPVPVKRPAGCDRADGSSPAPPRPGGIPGPDTRRSSLRRTRWRRAPRRGNRRPPRASWPPG